MNTSQLQQHFLGGSKLPLYYFIIQTNCTFWMYNSENDCKIYPSEHCSYFVFYHCFFSSNS